MWVIVTVASLAALILFVLCIPLDITFHLDVYGRPKFRIRLVWLFGLVSKEVRRGKKKPEEKERVSEGKRKPRERRRRAGAIFQILRTKGLLRQLKELLLGIVSSLKIRELVANLRVGLDNPADTGFLFALIGPLTFFLGSSRFHQIRVQPSFGDEAVFEGYTKGVVRLRPIRLVPPFIGFAFSLAAIRTLKVLILHKWKSKK